MGKGVFSLTLLIAAPLITTNFIVPVDAAVSCSSSTECELYLRPGSKCVDGFCSNPFVNGCLKTALGSLDHDEFAENFAPEVMEALDGRVCNSDDQDGASENGDCLENVFDYFEIRVHNADWESSIFVAWIMQIMLMEVLKVPVTVGLNNNITGKSSFYSPVNEIEYASVAYPWDALGNGADCEKSSKDCVHVLPEVWNGQASKWTRMMLEGTIEPVDGCGQVGKLGWFVPGATARRDNSLVSYYGLQGEENRAKLAKAFKRPTTWYEYCEEVSRNNCTTPDDVAEYYPIDEDQAIKFFEDGQYTGYFRMLPENDCTEFPTTCTGYFVGPLCHWDTNVDAQLYWNDIVGLKPDGPGEPNQGYEYVRQNEIWRAANATKSDVIMWWWQPEAMVQEFSNSDWSFQQVILPTVTDVCYRSRIQAEDRCSTDISIRRGSPLGACDDEAHALRKIISSSLQEKTMDQEEPMRSPGYPFIRALKISDIEIQSMLKKWMAINKDPYGNDAREAVCSWVIDHIDTLIGFIPPGYPRKLDETGSFDHGYIYFALSAASIGILGILITGFFVYEYRLTKVFVYAQVTFVYIILLGFLLVATGGLLHALEPTDITCTARNWLTSLGFSVVLAAVLVKMSTINRIMQSSKKLKRVQVSRKSMFGSLSLLVMIDLSFLIAWTVVSPSQASKNLVLPEEFGSIVEISTICRSSQGFWHYVLEGWHSLLLLVASVLAFQSRDIIPQFNESRSIGTMIYSQFLFMILRLIVFYLGFELLIAPDVFGASISLLYIFDTIIAIAIYIIPKCVNAKKDPDIYNPRASLSNYNSRGSFMSNMNARGAFHPGSEGFYRSSINATSEHNVPGIISSTSSDHGRRPLKLQTVSMQVNGENEVSNLQGRHQSCASFHQPSCCEVSNSGNDSLNGENSCDAMNESLPEENDGISIESHEKLQLTNLRSLDIQTDRVDEGAEAKIKSQALAILELQPLQSPISGDDSDLQHEPLYAETNVEKKADVQPTVPPSSSFDTIKKVEISYSKNIDNENISTPANGEILAEPDQPILWFTTPNPEFPLVENYVSKKEPNGS